MTDLVPVALAGAASRTPPVLQDLGFGGAMPAPPLARAWLESGGDMPARLRAAIWAPAIWRGTGRGTVLLLNGRTEYIEKHFRIIARLTAMGFAVATLDWRGQGMSTRRAKGTLGHIDDFAEFQRDMDAFLSWPALRSLPGPRVVLCHSMGGAIGLRALVDGRLEVDAAIFSAPFWGLGVTGAAGGIARGGAGAAVALGMGMRALPIVRDRRTYAVRHDFEDNVLTSDPEHFAWVRAQAEARPELTVGVPTYGWLAAAFRELEALRAAAAPELPSLLLVGDAERVVNAAPIRTWAEKAPHAVLTLLHGARHEPLMESPARNPGKAAWTAIEDFLRAEGI
jgi:lysophospholipase